MRYKNRSNNWPITFLKTNAEGRSMRKKKEIGSNHSDCSSHPDFVKEQTAGTKMSNEFLKDSLKLYTLLGCWPSASVEPPSSYERFKQSVGLLLVINSGVYNAFQYLDIYVEWGNLKYVSENATITFLYSIYLLKVFVFYTRRDEIVLISEEMDSYEEGIIFENDDRRKIDRLRSSQRRFKNYSTFFRSLACLTAVAMFSWPALTLVFTWDSSLRPMIARVHFPFSLDYFGNYAAAYLIEICFGVLMVLHVVAFDGYFIACILFAIARFHILRYSIETVNDKAMRKSTMTRSTSGKFLSHYDDSSEDEYQMILSVELKQCVEEHQRIAKFCKKIDSMLSLVLFATFFAYAVVMCFIGFYMVLFERSFNLLILGQYLSALIVETFFYYWYGNELMTESLKVADSAMKSDWQYFGKRNIKTIILIMLRSQKPILLTAGKFYAVTLSTLLSLARSSYSYFALLKQFYD